MSALTAPKRGGRALAIKGSETPLAVQEAWSVTAETGGRRRDLLSVVPLVAIIALVGMVGLLVWLVTRNEAEQLRVKLATDALWVEQTLRFQLSVDEDMLMRLALDAAGGAPPQALDARARLHVATNPEVLSVVWYDSAGRAARALPAMAAEGGDADLIAGMAGLSRVTRPVYGQVGPEGQVTMALPLEGGAGHVALTVSLPLMLDRHLPWWIAEQYGVQLRDSGDRVLAGRQRLSPAPGNPAHTISFDPPLRGAVLRITAYDPPAASRSALLVGAIAALAAFAVLALAVLSRSAARRRVAEARLRGETAFRRSMEDSLTVGLRAKDHAGRILYVNRAFCDLVGHEAADLVGRAPPMPYWDPAHLSETEARHRRLAAGGQGSQSFETRFRHADGREIQVQVFEAPLIDAGGVHRGWMGSVIDITEARRAATLARAQDETLARTGRLVTLGEMASTLAHELNQPLSAIASYATGMLNLMDQGKADPALLRGATEKLAQQAGRAGLIIRRIQDLVKKRAPHFAPVSLNEVIAETLGFLASDAQAQRVRLVADLHPVPMVSADRILLEQVLINLIRNGMEAMAETRHGDAVTLRLRAEEGLALIEVIDQGAGIAPDMAPHLFDAFASSKAQGMGMGLKICRSLIELHRGHLTYQSAEGGGTLFRVTMPLMTEAPIPQEESPQ